MKQTDEQLAKEYADSHGFRVPYNVHGREITNDDYYDMTDVKASEEGFLAGCQHKETEMVNKALRFAEFTSYGPYMWHGGFEKWMKRDGDYQKEGLMKTTAELYHSQAFSDWMKQFEK
jgi:hypothetical protein